MLPLFILLCADCAQAVDPTLFGEARFSPYTRHLKMLQTDLSKPQFKEIKFPETYIDPTVNYGLNMVLPERIRKRLLLNTGYDRWRGLPVITAEYFVPVRQNKDGSLFALQRMSLTAEKEIFSVGTGVRRMFGTSAMVGVHAFHDWVRWRGQEDPFLRNAGVGLELSALPGAFSDLAINANAYFPVKDRITYSPERPILTREFMPVGFDAVIGLKLPAFSKHVDSRLDFQFNSLRGERINVAGYKVGLSVNSRDGLWRVEAEHEGNNRTGAAYRIEARVTVSFDWTALLSGKSPISPPYQASHARFNRDLQPELNNGVARNHDLPVDKTSIELPQPQDVDAEVLPAKATDAQNTASALIGRTHHGSKSLANSGSSLKR
jgi:hypothetical protein